MSDKEKNKTTKARRGLSATIAGLGTSAAALGVAGVVKHKMLATDIKQAILGSWSDRPKNKDMNRILVHGPLPSKHGTGEGALIEKLIKGIRDSGINNPIDVYDDVRDAKQIPFAKLMPESLLNKLTSKYKDPTFAGEDVVNSVVRKQRAPNYFAEINAGSDLAHIGENISRSQLYKGFYKDMPEAVNIARTAGIHVNPGSVSAPANALSPFTNVDPRQLNKDKPAVVDFLKSVKPGIRTEGKKIVTISAGGTGIFLESLVPALAERLKGRDDVHVLVLKGSGDRVVGDLEAITEKAFGDRATVVGKLPQAQFNKLRLGSDLNIGYPGGSSLAEQILARNPSVTVVPDATRGNKALSVINAKWAQRRWGIPFIQLNDTSSSDIINDILDKPKTYERQASRRSKRAVKLLGDKNKNIISDIKRALHQVPGQSILSSGKTIPFRSSRYKIPKALYAGAGALGASAVLLYLLKELAVKKNMSKRSYEESDRPYNKARLKKLIAGAVMAGAGVYGLKIGYHGLPAWRNSSRLRRLGKLIEANHTKTIKSPKRMLDIHDMYGPLAQQLANESIAFTSIAGIAKKWPLSWIADRIGHTINPKDGKRAPALKSLLAELFRGKQTLGRSELNKFMLDRKHYQTVSRNPSRALAAEILTDSAYGRFSDVRPSIKRRVSRKIFDDILNRPGNIRERFSGYEDLLEPAIKERYLQLFMPKNKEGQRAAKNMESYVAATRGIAPIMGALGLVKGLAAVKAGTTDLQEEGALPDKEDIKDSIKSKLVEIKTATTRKELDKAAAFDNKKPTTVAGYGTVGVGGVMMLGAALAKKKAKRLSELSDKRTIGVLADSMDEVKKNRLLALLKKHKSVRSGLLDVADSVDAKNPVNLLVSIGENKGAGKLAGRRGLVYHTPFSTAADSLAGTGLSPTAMVDKAFTSYGKAATKEGFHPNLKHHPANIFSPNAYNVRHTRLDPASWLGSKTKSGRVWADAVVDRAFDAIQQQKGLAKATIQNAKVLHTAGAITGASGIAYLLYRLLSDKNKQK